MEVCEQASRSCVEAPLISGTTMEDHAFSIEYLKALRGSDCYSAPAISYLLVNETVLRLILFLAYCHCESY